MERVERRSGHLGLCQLPWGVEGTDWLLPVKAKGAKCCLNGGQNPSMREHRKMVPGYRFSISVEYLELRT